ncbi:uncharacterized protein LOC120157447 [Hibiscus syriacus]|uniref:uncharacterized protein LOC120157447 n=1 Tax=Hibiscus syriacus TaxID=106335 RepID=UPI00192178C5|nr:uncharacterized protein LOC120157447 [Hibiscus syriacus]
MTISLVEDEKEKQLQDDIIMGEIKNQPFLSLNKTGSLEDALVEVASNPNKVVSTGTTYLADFYFSVNQTTFAGETSNELKLEKVLDLESSSRTENVVNYTSYKMEVKEDKNHAPEDHSSMHLEDTNITAAEPVQEVVVWESDKIEVKEDSRLVEEDPISLQLEDTNTIAAEPAQEVVYWESEKDEVKEVTILAQGDHSSIHLEDTDITAAEPAQEQVFWESDKIEVKEDTSAALEDQNLMQFEDISITATEPVQERNLKFP